MLAKINTWTYRHINSNQKGKYTNYNWPLAQFSWLVAFWRNFSARWSTLSSLRISVRSHSSYPFSACSRPCHALAMSCQHNAIFSVWTTTELIARLNHEWMNMKLWLTDTIFPSEGIKAGRLLMRNLVWRVLKLISSWHFSCTFGGLCWRL